MNGQEKAWIDGASYEELLRRWRYAPAGDPMFKGDTGVHYTAVMAEKRAADPAGHVRASKSVGW